MNSRTNEELINLRKRARRRLVGAIVLSVVAVTILWNVVDGVPQTTDIRPESVQVVTNTPESTQPTEPPQPTLPTEIPQPHEPAAETSTAVNTTADAEKAAAERAVAEAAQASAEAFRQQQAQQTAEAERLLANQQAAAAAQIAEAERLALLDKERLEKEARRAAEQTARATKLAEERRAAEAKKAQEKTHTAAVRPERDPAAILEGRADPEPTKKSSRTYMVQVAALSDQAKAEAMRDKLIAAGLPAKIVSASTSKGTINRVRIGPFNNEDDARTAMKKLSGLGLGNGILMPQ